MALECKYFELNGINLVQFTHRIIDSTEPDTGTIQKLGDENRQFAKDDRGLRTMRLFNLFWSEVNSLKIDIY